MAIYMKLGDIDGEVTEPLHQKWIDIDSFSWGMSQVGTTARPEKAQRLDFSVVKTLDKSTPKLMEACCKGSNNGSVQIDFVKSSDATRQPEPYLIIKMTDCLITSFQTGGSGHGDVVPVDTISLNFSKIEFEYKPQSADGTFEPPVQGTCG